MEWLTSSEHSQRSGGLWENGSGSPHNFLEEEVRDEEGRGRELRKKTRRRGEYCRDLSWRSREAEQTHAWHTVVPQYVLAIIFRASLGRMGKGGAAESSSYSRIGAERSKRES